MADKHFTRLLSSENGFHQMMQRFGVVTVMNAHVYDYDSLQDFLKKQNQTEDKTPGDTSTGTESTENAGTTESGSAGGAGGTEGSGGAEGSGSSGGAGSSGDAEGSGGAGGSAGSKPIIITPESRPEQTPDTETGLTPYNFYKILTKELEPLFTLDTLKISNITIEGPSKTISGGRYNNPLIRWGKTARLEIRDALGHIDAIDALCGGIAEHTGNSKGNYIGLHIGEDFNTPKIIVGDTFFIDQKNQQQVPVVIMFYKFLPDSLFNLTQDAEGDASTFDMNGALLPVSIYLGNKESTLAPHDVFYSIIESTHDQDTTKR